MNIRVRLLGTYILFLLVSLFSIGGFLSWRVESLYSRTLDHRLLSDARLSAELLQPYLAGSSSALAQEVGGIASHLNMQVAILDRAGSVIAAAPAAAGQAAPEKTAAGLPPEVVQALKQGIGRSTRLSPDRKDEMRYVALLLPPATGSRRAAMPSGAAAGVSPPGPPLVLQLGLSTRDVRATMASFRRLIWQASLLVALLASLAVAWVVEPVTRSVAEMREAFRRMSQGNMGLRVPVRSRDEMGDLAAHFNAMAERLESSIEELTSRKKEMEAVLTGMADGVIALDREGRVMLANPAAEAVVGMSRERMLGQHLLSVVRHHELEHVVMETLASGQARQLETTFLAPKEATMQVSITPITAAPRLEGVVLVFHDITDLRRLERMRSDFVSNVSHELRTPLTSIKGFIETLLETPVEDKETYRHFLEIARQETDRLSRLIDDLLDLSRLESKRVEPKWQVMPLAPVVDRVMAMLESKAKSRQVELSAHLPANLPPAYADPDMVGQVLINLVDNAVKYTGAGGQVQVRAAVAPGGDMLQVSVRDTGIGIPPEHLGRIFERFYRVDKARSRALGGTGLGLSIVKHTLERLGGSISVQSEVGKGSTFTFTLPRAYGERKGPSADAKA